MLAYDDEDVAIEVVIDASPGIEPSAYNAVAAGDDLERRHAEEGKRVQRARLSTRTSQMAKHS